MAELKINYIYLRPNNQKRQTDNQKNQTDIQSDDFIPKSCRYLEIQLGDCKSSFDLKSFHFKIEEYSHSKSAVLNHTIKVKNFHENDKVTMFWQDTPYEIERSKNIIALNTDCLSLIFRYNLSIDEIDVNDETSTKKASIPIENKEEKYQKPYIPIKKQQIHSFLEDNDIENILPKVDF